MRELLLMVPYVVLSFQRELKTDEISNLSSFRFFTEDHVQQSVVHLYANILFQVWK